MRHTNNLSYVSFRSNNRSKAYAVEPSILKKIQALLKESNAKETDPESSYLSAEVVFPELKDPIMGPANYLRGIRLREGLTQAQLADKALIKQHHVSEMENGKRTITKANAKKLAAILNTDWRRMV